MFLVSVDRSEVPTHTEDVRLLLKLSFLVEFFDFRSHAAHSVCGAGI
jgi:hypothetical protein